MKASPWGRSFWTICAAVDGCCQNVFEHPEIKPLALFKVAEGWAARGLGRGAGCALGFGQKVHGYTRAGGNHFLDC